MVCSILFKGLIMAQMKILVFDWGDTLMTTYPESIGPMAFWPEVAEVEGAGEALRRLSEDYTIILATNARESSAKQVQMALRRVGLDPFIQKIFTYHELGFWKPERGFYRKIEKMMGTEPEDMVMVGDNFESDALGGHLAGWHTIWFNPLFNYAPGLGAIQNMEIYRMEELAGAIKYLELPGWETCQKWYMEVSRSIRLWLHVQMVASTAYVLALWIRRNGKQINPLLAQRGGLLHDICKLKKDEGEGGDHRDHGVVGVEWLAERGQPELANIARRHILDGITDETRRPQTLEEKVVYFADKLCEDASLVDIDTRLSALKRRYPDYASRMTASEPALKELQKELALAAGVDEAEMLGKIRQVIGKTS